MSRGDQLQRQWSILRLVSSGRKSRRELAERLGVSRKTIMRDVEALSLFPIAEEHEGIDVYYQLLRDANPPRVQLEGEEIAALLLGERAVLAALEGTPYHDHVSTALAKLRLLQRDRADRRRRALPEVFQSSFHEPRGPASLRERLLDAAIERRRVWIRYFTAERQERSERVVEPHALHLHPHGFHLIAYCLTRSDFLYFSVPCIEALRVLDETFDPEGRGLDLDAFLATTFDGQRGNPVLDVCLRIKAPTAHWARHHAYHPTQEIREIEGGVEIRFRSGAPEAIAARVLSLGPDCEVVAPALLRRLVRRRAAEIGARYHADEDSADPGPDLSGARDTPSTRPGAEERGPSRRERGES